MAATTTGNLLEGGIATAGLFDQINRVEGIGEDAVSSLNTIGNEAVEATQFKPFSVASNTGNAQVAADGSIDANLSEGFQGASDSALQGATGFFESAALDPATRQGAIFEQLMAGLAPQQERERLALEGRLQSQGRGGITSAQFGGSPEQFALAKAQEEAKLSAMVQSRGIGSAEQLQEANIGSQFLTNAQTPTAGLFNQLTPGVQTANLSQVGTLAGEDIRAQTGVAGVEANVNAAGVAANLYGTGFNALANTAGGFGDYAEGEGGLLEGAKGAFDEFMDLF